MNSLDTSQSAPTTPQMILDEIACVGFDKDAKHSDRLKALEMLAKHSGLFPIAPNDSLDSPVIFINDLGAHDD